MTPPTAGQHAEIARGGVEPHRAGEVRRTDDVVEQHLVRRLPQHAGTAVNHQQHHRVPHLQGVGDEEVAPAEGRDDEQSHAALDEPSRIEAVGERAGGDREQQERQPVRHHRKAGERGRLEFLKDHPVADHVLDVVGHHREREGEELGAEARIVQRRKGLRG
jgi:hypothetical protein